MNDKKNKNNSEEKIKTYGSLIVIILGIILIFGWGLLIGNLIFKSNNNSKNKVDDYETENIEKEVEKVNSIESFTFSYTNGYMVNSDVRYSLVCDDECLILIKRFGEENSLEYEADNMFIDRLINLINDNELIKWNGFNKNNESVLDGDSFSLNVKYNNGKEIEAYGYMIWPENYKYVKKEIEMLFDSIY